jgi:hypothetical protein
MALIRTPNPFTLKGKRDRALLALMIKLGLRRSEIAALTFGNMRKHKGQWFLKLNAGDPIPLPRWIKLSIDRWTAAGGLRDGRVFRSVNRWGKITSDRLTPASIHKQLIDYGYWVGLRFVPFVPSRAEIVQKMLSMAKLKKHDVLYDLGSGDGRIVIEAAKRYAVSAVGIEMDPLRIEMAYQRARVERVDRMVQFIKGDFFRVDISKASVVTMFLLQTVNLELRARLLSQLAPGTRIVSHRFHMGNWKPKRVAVIGNDKIYYWRVPKREVEIV